MIEISERRKLKTFSLLQGCEMVDGNMLFAMYEKNGQPLEVVIRNIYRVCFQRPKQRPYKTNNFYAVLERQNQLDREVYQIVRKEKADPRRTKTDRSRHRKSEPNG